MAFPFSDPLPINSKYKLPQGAGGIADFGKDISALPDLDPSFSLKSGNQVLAEAIARRLQTPRGGLVDDAQYGKDLRAHLNDGLTSADLPRIKADAESECEKDERIISASADASFDSRAQRLNISITLNASTGSFPLVLGVTAVSVDVLQVG